MTKKIKTLDNNKYSNDWIASLSFEMTTTMDYFALLVMTTFFVIARKNFNFFVAIHLSLIIDCFAFARNDDNGKKKDVYCLIDSRSTALRE